jgi:GAF domain-containing protein
MTDYKMLKEQAKGLMEADNWYVPVMSNLSALIYESLEDLNWAGFYLVMEDQLVLGPFQGKVACIHIGKGKGVCGTAFEKDQTLLVKNVHDFPGHIACDSASNSEIVVPIHNGGQIVAVLDIDSPLTGRFTEADREGLEALVKEIEQRMTFEMQAFQKP